ncbi:MULTISPECIES: hypothetical protein [unclassified Spiroplasma]|uniref:hypothetical protein n=1 Tax=unclassified Spiroplasma TaxID=2637901 RepID=UPI0027DF73F4|nr:hypothetical protein [Spiroplasma sp. AdecLV25b]
MLNKNKMISLGLIIGMIMSLVIFMTCIIYGIVTIISYFSSNVILIIIFGLFQIVPFLLCLNSYLNHERQLFVTGLISLTSFVIPGVVILIGYFIKQKRLLKIKFNT